jgi:hypothetical protein
MALGTTSLPPKATEFHPLDILLFPAKDIPKPSLGQRHRPHGTSSGSRHAAVAPVQEGDGGAASHAVSGK